MSLLVSTCSGKGWTFLKLASSVSSMQIIGRAARNSSSKVVLYADKMTDSIKKAVSETERRRTMQVAYNKEHGIIPTTIRKPIREKVVDITDVKHIPKTDIPVSYTHLRAHET